MGFTFEAAGTKHPKGQNLGKSEHWPDSMPQILLYEAFSVLSIYF